MLSDKHILVVLSVKRYVWYNIHQTIQMLIYSACWMHGKVTQPIKYIKNSVTHNAAVGNLVYLENYYMALSLLSIKNIMNVLANTNPYPVNAT